MQEKIAMLQIHLLFIPAYSYFKRVHLHHVQITHVIVMSE